MDDRFGILVAIVLGVGLWFVLALPAPVTGNAVLLQPAANVSVGSLVRFDIAVTDAVDLAGVQMSFVYDASRLQYLRFAEGTFLNQSGAVSTYVGNATVSSGAIDDIVIVRLNASGVNGNGVVFSLYFNATAPGTASVNFTESLLSDSNGSQIAMAASDNTVTISGSDTFAPTISIIDPVDGAVRRGTVSVIATASDPAGVGVVRFFVDGTQVGTDSSSPYQASFNSATYGDGAHTITVSANDTLGNTGNTSISVDFDNSAPSVNITAPAAASTVSGIVMISATATDLTGVAGVQFRVNGTAVGAEDTLAPYTVSWTTGANGTHNISATARDLAGNTATTSRLVTVNNTASGDSTRPTIVITSPASGASVSGTTTIAATATDNVAIQQVLFSIDGSLLGADNSSPYSISWETTSYASGAHTINATAVDTSANTQSTSITVTVSQPSTPPKSGGGGGGGGGGGFRPRPSSTNATNETVLPPSTIIYIGAPEEQVQRVAAKLNVFREDGSIIVRSLSEDEASQLPEINERLTIYKAFTLTPNRFAQGDVTSADVTVDVEDAWVQQHGEPTMYALTNGQWTEVPLLQNNGQWQGTMSQLSMFVLGTPKAQQPTTETPAALETPEETAAAVAGMSWKMLATIVTAIIAVLTLALWLTVAWYQKRMGGGSNDGQV